MVTIDVNTGRFVGGKDQEQTIFETNLLSAKEIARQIRLRDIGGLIICDFIDMYSRENRRRLFEAFKSYFANDRAKRGINPVTEFGLIELTRERVRPSHMATLSEACPCCGGLGRIMSKENVATKIERWFIRARAEGKYSDFHLVINPNLAEVMTNGGANRLHRISRVHRCRINVVMDTTLPQQQFKVYSAEGNADITEQYSV
jgi:ribonuclease G